jgi:endonuclease YncB( thermonuclease family)
LTALTADNKQVKIRLVEIDAPEASQNFGQKSKKSLSDICFKKPVVVVEKGKDKYKRTLARLFCYGVDANAEQVKRGMAWAFQKYITDQNIDLLDKAARKKKVGLWQDPNPIPPWEFRHPNQSSTLVSTDKCKASHIGCGQKTMCRQMESCKEARFYLDQCGVTSLDGNHDGIPCATLCR